MPFVAGGASRPRVELVEGMEAQADLDRDGRDELAVLLTESSGGSGQFHYLAVFTAGKGGWSHLGTVGIGDRIQVRSFDVAKGRIQLDFVAPGEGEPACCASMKMRSRFGLDAQGLNVVESEALGPLGLVDLGGIDWRLIRFTVRDRVPDGVAVTARFAEGKVAGSAGCNRYFTAIDATTPYDAKVGPIGLTSMMCPDAQMDVERRFLAALEGMTRFGFLRGMLALGYRAGEAAEEVLLFEPGDGAE